MKEASPARLNLPSENVFKELFNAAAEGLVVVDKSGTIQLVNPRVEHMFGYKKEELIGRPVEILMPDSFRQGHRAHRQAYVEKPEQRSMGGGMDLKGSRKDGSEFFVEISLNYFESDGELYVMALISDITLRKQVEQELHELNEDLESKVGERTTELRKSQQLHTEIARNFPDGSIIVVDKDFQYLFAEGQKLAQAGLTGEKLVGKEFVTQLPLEFRDLVVSKLQAVLEGDPQTFEVGFNGETYRLQCVPLRDDKQEIERILIVEQNISAERQAKEDIRRAFEEERRLNDWKSRFVSLASHEFRTPLATILSSTSLLRRYQEEQFAEKRVKHIDRIHKSVKHLNGLLDEFLSIEKLEAGKIEPRPEMVELMPFAEALVEDVRSYLGEGQEVQISNQGKTEFITDPQIFRNLLINLLSNAIKYSPEGSSVDLDFVIDGYQVHVTVKDYGIGIPKNDQQHLFTRFYRATNAGDIQGTGLGLNIVDRYSRLIGGNIDFESEEGVGTTFRITIPQMTLSDEEDINR